MRILHTMIRVGNLERSIKFYETVLGMQQTKHKEYPNGRFTLVFMGYRDESEDSQIELTYNWDTDSYNLGDGFGHIAILVEGIYKVCDLARNFGVRVTREPGPMKFGGDRNIAFIEDPDGYKIELIEQKSEFKTLHTHLEWGNT